MTPKEIALSEHLQSFLTDERKALFERNLQWRTRHVTAVMENIFNPHNASAVMRSCECFGVQDAHLVVERYGGYEVNKDIVAGASKWIDIYEHATTPNAYRHLKEAGYKIVATSPHATQTLDELDLSAKTAFVFGAEVEGITNYAMEHADEQIVIPMFGFTESFNISVSAALCLRSFITRLHQSDVAWQYTEEERQTLRLEWLRRSVREAGMHERYFEKHIWQGNA